MGSDNPRKQRRRYDVSDMPSGFELFRWKNRSASSMGDAPAVSIGKRGAITLNQAAHKALGNPGAVELLYNATDRTIGIRSAVPGGTHAYRLTDVQNKGTTFTISGQAFLHHYQLVLLETVRRRARLTNHMLVVSLDSEPTDPAGDAA